MPLITSDQSLVNLKHQIYQEVCRLEWDDHLTPEGVDELVMKLIPGPKSTYRCCIYKEREIVRQRIRLATGYNPDPTDKNNNLIQVIKPACDDCPISAYSVTDSCRFCLGRACVNSCRFNAIAPGIVRMHIDAEKCKECGMCAKACPYGAIVRMVRPCKKACPANAITYDEYNLCHIDESKCIHCGHCIHSCPFGALGSKTYLVDIIRHIKAGDRVIAMCAPATEGQFGEKVSMQVMRTALMQLGFSDMIEVGLGGDMTAAYEALEWSEARETGRKMTTSCCPAFVNLLKKHYPTIYKENMSSTVSPMVAVSRYVKHKFPDAITVFIGPCIAKKSESQDESIPGNADYALTFGEIEALLKSKDIEFEEDMEVYQDSSLYGKKFATTGGVASAVLQCMSERGEDVTSMKLLQVAGGDDVKKAMMALKAGRLPEDFVEVMMCTGGCVGGPSKVNSEQDTIRARRKLLATADKRNILQNLEQYPMDQFSMFRDGHMSE